MSAPAVPVATDRSFLRRRRLTGLSFGALGDTAALAAPEVPVITGPILQRRRRAAARQPVAGRLPGGVRRGRATGGYTSAPAMPYHARGYRHPRSGEATDFHRAGPVPRHASRPRGTAFRQPDLASASTRSTGSAHGVTARTG